jgi:hypothetical protein
MRRHTKKMVGLPTDHRQATEWRDSLMGTAMPDQAGATLIAAIVAASSALIGVFVNIYNGRVLPKREALRKVLETELNNIGSCLYLMVSLSQKMVDAKSQDSFLNFQKMAEEQRQELNKLRSKLRYSLWGLDQGLREIRSIPFYIGHYKNSRPNASANKLVRLATKLRVALDTAILLTYVSGTPPGRWSRLRIWFWGWRLRRCFTKGRPPRAQKS